MPGDCGRGARRWRALGAAPEAGKPALQRCRGARGCWRGDARVLGCARFPAQRLEEDGVASRGVVWSGRVGFLFAAVIIFMLVARQCGPGGGVLRVATGGDEERATAIVEALNEAGLRARLVETRSAIASVEALAAGEADFAVVPADVAWYAVNGTGIFEKETGGFFAVMPVEVRRVCVVARRDAGIRSIAELRGKRVVVGAPGSTVELTANHVLEAYGLGFGNLGRAIRLTAMEAESALRNGEADATFFVGGTGSRLVRLLGEGPFSAVPIAAPHVERLREKYPFYLEAELPGRREGVPAVATVGLFRLVVAHEGVPADEVVKLTEMLDGQGNLLAGYEDVSAWAHLLPIERHPGSREYFKAKVRRPGSEEASTEE